MKIFGFISIILVFSLQVQASQYERVKTQCIEQRDWSQVKCHFSKDQIYGYTDVSYTATQFVWDGIHITNKVVQLGDNLLSHITLPGMFPVSIPSAGTVKRKSIISLLDNYFNEAKVTSCQKACIIKCASANILEYQLNENTRYEHAKKVYEEEEGVCTEFSVVFDDLAAQFDLPSKRIANVEMRHAYNKVKIDGEWVYLEPQSPSCDFYTDHPEDFEPIKISSDFENMKERSYNLENTARQDRTYIPSTILEL